MRVYHGVLLSLLALVGCDTTTDGFSFDGVADRSDDPDPLPVSERYPHLDAPSPLFVAGLDRWEEEGVAIDGPNELAFDAQGRLWAGDQENLRVQVFAPDGGFLASLGGEGTGPGEFTWSEDSNRGPESVRPGPDGGMYVVDRIGRRVNVYDAEDLISRPSLALPGFEDPTGLAITSDGRLYAADEGRDEIHIFSLDGSAVGALPTEHAGRWILDEVETLAVDESRDLLFATSEDDEEIKVFRVSSGEYVGEVTDRGGSSSPPGLITDTIEGIMVDPSRGLLFICDEEPGRIMIHDLDSDRLFDRSEDFGFLGSFGGAGSDEGEFDSPDGIAVSVAFDRLAIADQGNGRVQVFVLSDLLAQLDL